MLIQVQAGALPNARQPAGTPAVPGGTFGELLASELTPRYYSLVKAGKVFSLAAAAATPTSFTGGAGGTPLIGLFNPVASGVDLVILQTRLAVKTTGTAAVNWDAGWYAVNQGGVAVTGTQTAPRNMYSQANTGSAAYGMVNTANTAALASTLVAPVLSGGLTAATAVTDVQQALDDTGGSLVIAPGCYAGFGTASSGALTASVFDCVVIWAEIPA